MVAESSVFKLTNSESITRRLVSRTPRRTLFISSQSSKETLSWAEALEFSAIGDENGLAATNSHIRSLGCLGMAAEENMARDFTLKRTSRRIRYSGSLVLVLLAWALFYSPPTKCDGEGCINIGGEWQGSERGTLTCTLSVGGESETDTQSFSGSAHVTLFQDPGSYAVRYTPPGIPNGIQGGERTGFIVGDRLTVRGIAAVALPGVTLTKNTIEASGQVSPNAFTLMGTGSLEGSAVEDGVTLRFVCTLQSQADLTRIASVTLAPLSQSFPAAGGEGSVTVAASSGGNWTAHSSATWITITSGASGSGNGTVNYRVAANTVRTQRSGTMTIGGKSFAVTQAAGVGGASETLFVPIILSSAGANNSFFSSELTLTNRGTGPTLLELTYTAAFGGGSGTTTDTLLAGQQIVQPDAIEYLRTRGLPIPATGNRGGTLSVRFTGLASPSEAAVTVRTTSHVPGGRAGLAYMGIPVSQALTGPAYLCGLRQNMTDRSNVAIQNAGSAQDGNILLRLTVFSGDSAVSQRLPDVMLTPGEFKQFSGILGSSYGMQSGYVRVERVSGRAPFYAYGVINDQFNSDGSFVPPVLESSLIGRSGFTLPVIVDSGAFSTELVLTNWSAVAKTLRLALVSDSVQTSNLTAQFQITLNPGQQLIVPRIVQYLRERNVAGLAPAGSSTVGALFATVTGGDARGVFLGARTAAPGGGGQYGLFYPATPYGRASTSSGWIYGLRQDAENRTNLALVNTGEASQTASTFRIEIFDGNSGAKVSTVDGVTVGSQRWMQINVFLARHAPGTPHAYARVTRLSGTNPFIAYAVINDGASAGERTGDGAYVPMDSRP